MRRVAKLFKNGRSQAVRLPASFRFAAAEVYVRQDTVSGDLILSRKPGSWKDFFALVDSVEVPPNFLAVREKRPPQKRSLF